MLMQWNLNLNNLHTALRVFSYFNLLSCMGSPKNLAKIQCLYGNIVLV